MKNYFLEDKLKKLENLKKDDILKMLYQWIKQDNISLSEFKIIINKLFINNNELI
jgi:hypothetical protein